MKEKRSELVKPGVFCPGLLPFSCMRTQPRWCQPLGAIPTGLPVGGEQGSPGGGSGCALVHLWWGRTRLGLGWGALPCCPRAAIAPYRHTELDWVVRSPWHHRHHCPSFPPWRKQSLRVRGGTVTSTSRVVGGFPQDRSNFSKTFLSVHCGSIYRLSICAVPNGRLMFLMAPQQISLMVPPGRKTLDGCFSNWVGWTKESEDTCSFQELLSLMCLFWCKS